jgi:hypothetical protein
MPPEVSQSGGVIGPIPEAGETVAFFYCNGVNLGFSPFDFMFTFNMNAPGRQGPIAMMAMSPQQARLLSDLLAQKVAEWEETFGRLYQRDELEERLKAFAGARKATDQNPTEPEPPSSRSRSAARK